MLPTIVLGGLMANLSMLKSRLKIIASVIVLSTTIAPAFADRDDDRNRNNGNNNRHGWGWGWGRHKKRSQ
jgi:predicted glutamine amidotransferase